MMDNLHLTFSWAEEGVEPSLDELRDNGQTVPNVKMDRGKRSLVVRYQHPSAFSHKVLATLGFAGRKLNELRLDVDVNGVSKKVAASKDPRTSVWVAAGRWE